MKRTIAALVLGLAAVGALVAEGHSENTSSTAQGNASPAYSSAGINWRQAAGQTIVLGGEQHPWMTAIKPLLPEFTKLTGIDVQVQTASETEFVSRMPIALAGGSKTPDVFMVWDYGQAVAAGWLEPLDKYFNDKSLTNLSWYDPSDIYKSARDFPIWSDGHQYAVAITAEAETLYINRSALQAAGLQPPKTMQELYSDAVKLKNNNMAGIVMRAKPTASSVPWTAAGFIFSYGGQIIDQNGRAVFDSPEAIQAVEMYAKLLREAGPVGVGNYDWYEALTAFMQGRAAIAIDTSNFATDIANPDKSKEATNTIFAAFPNSSQGQAKPNMWFWLLGMNHNSAHKTAAWLLIQWLTSKPTSLQIADAGVATPRISAWQSAGFQKKFGSQASEAALANLKNADAKVMTRAWLNPKSPQVLNLLAVAINQVITGQKDAKTALTQAAAQANQILGK